MGHFGLTQINWHVKRVYCGLCGLTRLWHVSYRVTFGSTRLWPKPIKRSNPNLKKHVSGSCRVCGLGRTLTPLIKYNTGVKSFVFYLFHAIHEIISSFSFFVKSSHLFRKEKSHGTFNVDPFSFFHGFIFFIVTTFQLMGLIFFTKIIIIIINLSNVLVW